MYVLNGGIVNWKSSKEEMIVDSIIELKYIISSDGNGIDLDIVVHL